jgi:hypothetical protein
MGTHLSKKSKINKINVSPIKDSSLTKSTPGNFLEKEEKKDTLNHETLDKPKDLKIPKEEEKLLIKTPPKINKISASLDVKT